MVHVGILPDILIPNRTSRMMKPFQVQYKSRFAFIFENMNSHP